MRVLVWMGLLLVLTIVCSVAGLAGMVGMPLGDLPLTVIGLLTALVGGLGVALIVAPDRQLAPLRVDR
jgi:hypothetical protein